MPPKSKSKSKSTSRLSPTVANRGSKRALSPGEESTPKRAKTDRVPETPIKASSSSRSSARRASKATIAPGSSGAGSSRRARRDLTEDRSPTPATQAAGSDNELSSLDARVFIDDEAAEDGKEEDYDPTEPEEDDGGSIRAESPEAPAPTTNRLRRQHAMVLESTSPSKSRATRDAAAPQESVRRNDARTARESAPPSELGALTALIKLVSETPELLTLLNTLGTVGSAQQGEASASKSARPAERVSHASPPSASQPTISQPASPAKASRGDETRVPETPTASQAGSPDKGARDAAADKDDGDDSKFDGSKNCLDRELWIPELRAMYRKVRAPPRIVRFLARSSTAELVAVSIKKWTKHPLFGFMKQLLEVGSTSQYVNISRMSHRNLRVEHGGTVSWPLNYITRRGTTEPALFMSLVEVKKSSLLTAEEIPRRDPPGHFEKKILIANLFKQELELLVCTLGCIYNASKITLPCWSGKEDDRGLTFHTKVTPLRDGNAIQSSPAKRGLFDPSPSAGKSTKQPLQIVGAERVPVFDASVDGFDLNMPFKELQMLPDMEEEPAPGSVGVAFYTISDTRDHGRIEFNIHAFAFLAEPSIEWSETD